MGVLLLATWLPTACRRAPSAAEALAALRLANPAQDTATAVARVWADGPPWFSCAEVIAKLRAKTDSAVVRDQVGNWRPLLLADWVALRDTAARTVVDPGWCAARLLDEAARAAGGWRPIVGDSLPSGGVRRGWDVPAGRRRIVVREEPRTVGRDSASVDYVLTIAPNENGVALRSAQESVRHRALLIKEEGRWRVLDAEWGDR